MPRGSNHPYRPYIINRIISLLFNSSWIHLIIKDFKDPFTYPAKSFSELIDGHPQFYIFIRFYTFIPPRTVSAPKWLNKILFGHSLTDCIVYLATLLDRSSSILISTEKRLNYYNALINQHPQLTGRVSDLLLGQLGIPDNLLLGLDLTLLGGLLGQAALVHRSVSNAHGEEGPSSELEERYRQFLVVHR